MEKNMEHEMETGIIVVYGDQDFKKICGAFVGVPTIRSIMFGGL